MLRLISLGARKGRFFPVKKAFFSNEEHDNKDNLMCIRIAFQRSIRLSSFGISQAQPEDNMRLSFEAFSAFFLLPDPPVAKQRVHSNEGTHFYDAGITAYQRKVASSSFKVFGNFRISVRHIDRENLITPESVRAWINTDFADRPK
jgi:hypothetical protein